MINWIAASSVLIVVILLIRKLFEKKMTPGLQYVLWLLVAVRLLVPINFFYSSYSLPEMVNKIRTVTEREDYETYIIGENGMEHAIEGEPDGKYVPPDTQAVSVIDHTYYPAEKESGLKGMFSGRFSFLYVIWLIGMAVTGGIFLLVNLFFRIRIYSDREEIEEEELEKRKLTSKVPVYITRYVATPCLAGLKKPAVYLPQQIWESMTEARAEGSGQQKNRELDAMICHENVHYRHGDQFWGFLRLLCMILHWYNPLVWVAALVSKQDAEMFCDAGVVRKMGEKNRYEYGRILLDTTLQENEELGRLSVQLSHAGLCNTEMADTKKHIEKRIKKLTAKPKRSTAVIALTLLFSLMAFSYLFIGSEGQDSLFWKISTMHNSRKGEVLITQSVSSGEKMPEVSLSEDEEIPEEFLSKDGEISENTFPKKEEVEEVREAALAGMSETEIEALTTYVKDYHNWMEYRLLYENWESRLSDKNSVVWNFFDKTGEIQAGWILEDDLAYALEAGEEERKELQEKYPEFGKVSLEELGAKYGEPYYEENRYGADTVIQRMKELTASAENEIFQSDVKVLCEVLQQAKDTHEVDYVMQVHEILHDMEYFLLRYSPQDVSPYTQDKSLSVKYYGALEVWSAWREGRL